MRTLNVLSLVVILCLIVSCKKNKGSDQPKTNMELLTSKTWIYDEYFTNYNSSNTILAYKRTKANNSINLSANRTKYNTDGTVSEINQNGQSVPGTWKFLNNDTQIQVINSVGTFTSTIISLNENSLIWYDQSANGGTYGKMIPQ